MAATIIRESIEEFFARGGKTNKIDNGSKQTATSSQLIKKDRKLAALRKLLTEIQDNDEAYTRVQAAIDERYDILKGL